MTRRPKPKLVHLPKPELPSDHQLITSLVEALREARAGKVAGFALTMIMDGDGAYTVHSHASVHETDHRYLVLGAMRRLEHRFLAQQWPDDEPELTG
jgi:hypothetical protein